MALGMLLQTSFTAFLKKKRDRHLSALLLRDNFSEIFPAFTRVLWEHLFSFVLEAVRALSTLLAFVPKTGRAMRGHVDIVSLATRVSLAATSSCMCGIHSCFSPRSGIVHAMVQTTVPSPIFYSFNLTKDPKSPSFAPLYIFLNFTRHQRILLTSLRLSVSLTRDCSFKVLCLRCQSPHTCEHLFDVSANRFFRCGYACSCWSALSYTTSRGVWHRSQPSLYSACADCFPEGPVSLGELSYTARLLLAPILPCYTKSWCLLVTRGFFFSFH